MEVLSDGGGEGSRLASYTKEIISGKNKQTVVSKLVEGGEKSLT